MIGLCGTALGADSDWAPVAKALGRSGSEMPGGVYRVGLGRSDLKVMLDGVQIKPPLALGSYLAFQKMCSDGMVMGDLVLLHEEVNPVMKKLIEGGIEITALHNHLLRSSPATMYMHFSGHGDPVKLATVLREALSQSKTPLAAPAPAGSPPPIELDTGAIERAPKPYPTVEWTCRSPRAPESLSTSSRPAEARRRSPAISCSRQRK
jgi:hypothetical protein